MTDVRPPRPRWTLGRIRAFLRFYVVGISTKSGRATDLFIIFMILVATGALIVESIPRYGLEYRREVRILETAAGIVFVFEYAARLWTARKPLDYVFSFWGIVDLLAILPLLLQDVDLAFIRTFRILRVFAILKVVGYTSASAVLVDSLIESRTKIFVFLMSVCTLVLVIAFMMHLIEPESFATIPDAIWWTVVTITTVGYGDYVPTTFLGKTLAAFTMLTAFGIIGVPTGIIAAEIGSQSDDDDEVSTRTTSTVCGRCGLDTHLISARYCCRCAEPIAEDVLTAQQAAKPKKKKQKRHKRTR